MGSHELRGSKVCPSRSRSVSRSKSSSTADITNKDGNKTKAGNGGGRNAVVFSAADLESEPAA